MELDLVQEPQPQALLRDRRCGNRNVLVPSSRFGLSNRARNALSHKREWGFWPLTTPLALPHCGQAW